MSDQPPEPPGAPDSRPTAVEAPDVVEAGQRRAAEAKARARRQGRMYRRRRDWAGLVAKAICVLFAVLGIVPLGLGMLARLEAVQTWLAQETAATLRRELGVTAHYELSVQPWPLQLAMDNLVIEASDGGSPFLHAQRVVARPRLFSLLAGKLDFGQIEIESPRIRAVVRDGALQNLDYHLPESPPDDEPDTEQTIPLSALSLTNAWLDVVVDDNRVRASHLDADLTTDQGPPELSLRAGLTRIDRVHPAAHRPDVDWADEDVLCRVDLRARIAPEGLLVRRLRLLGAVDMDPDPHTGPSCDLVGDDWRRFELEVEAFRVDLEDGALKGLDGRVQLRLPTALAHRFVEMPPLTGWVMADLDVHYDGTTRLPVMTGRVGGRELSIDGRYLAHSIIAEVDTADDVVRASKIRFTWASARATVRDFRLEPFTKGIPLVAKDIEITDLVFEDMLDDLAAHPRTHVGWLYERAVLDEFGGTITPLELSGVIELDTSDFGVFDKPTTDPNRWKIIGVDRAKMKGTFEVRPNAIVLNNFAVNTGRSRLVTTVSLGFDEILGVTIAEGSLVDLDDISPLADIPMSGQARIKVDGGGEFNNPIIDAEMSVRDFELAGFPLGHIERARVHFEPLKFEVLDGRLLHDASVLDVPRLEMDFDAGADVVMEASIDSRTQAGLLLTDLFEMIRFDDVPAFQGIEANARGPAEVHFVLGGVRDRCRSGRLRVRTQMDLSQASIWGEPYPTGHLDGDLLWDDMDAGQYGIELQLHSAVLRKGTGTIVARGALHHGAILQADITGSGIPLDQFKAYESLFGAKLDATDPTSSSGVRPEATMAFVAAVGGTLDALQAKVDVDLSALRIGPDTLPSSQLHIALEPTDVPPRPAGQTRCGNRRPAPPRLAGGGDDPIAGVVELSGSLFGGQIQFDDLQITQQRAAMLSGQLQLRELDLGTLANLLPDVAFSSAPPSGSLTATVQIDELPLDDPALAEIQVFVDALELERSGQRLRVGKVAEPIVVSGDALRVPELPLHVRLGSGLAGNLIVGGSVDRLSTRQDLGLTLRLDPVDLSALGMEIPQLERAAGQISAKLHLGGTVAKPTLNGQLGLQDGALRIKGFPVSLDDIDLDVRITPDEIQVRRAVARTGTAGHLALSARLPLRGFKLAGASATLVARGVRLPVTEGVRLTADAMLNASYVVSEEGSPQPLPNITGTLSLSSFSYTRPMSLELDLDRLTGGGATKVETYNPAEDLFTFDITLMSPQPLTLSNNLLDMKVEVTPPGLRLMGTNQRFGGRGNLRIVPGSKIYLQGHDFAVRDGKVTFDNPSRIAPRLDVYATTEYRRYATSAQVEPGAAEAGSAASSAGRWRIAVHATGDTDAPKVRFSSDPPLSQEDIILLLQVGMTRAELDRGLTSSIAQSVGLEALSAATGLDQAVRSTVPIIDEFRFSSQYSSRTGRTEPTATIGKRITDDVRASVTTGLTDNREVRSNVEWKLGSGVSVEGSYDNVNDMSSSGLGNLGADLRWRLEFD